MIVLLGLLSLILLFLARNKYIDSGGLTVAEEKISNWVSTIGFLFALVSLCISYLVFSDPGSKGLRFHQLGITIRIILGSGGIGYGLKLAQRGAHRNLVRNVVLWAVAILVPPLVEILA